MTESRLRIVFFGTPQIALPALSALYGDPQFDIAAVVTQTDKPSGRGHKLKPSPVKQLALANGSRIFQPISLKKPERADGLPEFLTGTPVDFFVVVAYGKIITPELLAAPRHGAINIHFSLLPRWRGAAPVQRAILAGDPETGIAIMKMDEGLDTGPVYETESVLILPEHTSGSLSESLAEKGAAMLRRTLPEIAGGLLKHRDQPGDGATYAEKLTAADFRIDWRESAFQNCRRIQAGSPFPGAKSTYQGETVKVFSPRVAPSLGYQAAPAGTIVECNKRELIVAAGKNEYLAIQELQFPNRKRLTVQEILNSRDLPAGSRFGEDI